MATITEIFDELTTTLASVVPGLTRSTEVDIEAIPRSALPAIVWVVASVTPDDTTPVRMKLELEGVLILPLTRTKGALDEAFQTAVNALNTLHSSSLSTAILTSVSITHLTLDASLNALLVPFSISLTACL